MWNTHKISAADLTGQDNLGDADVYMEGKY
jgi:hypothetical protein